MATTVDFNAIAPKIIGVKRIGYALLSKNTVEELIFGPVKQFSRLKKISLAPVYAENPLYSNDSVEASGNEIIGYTLTADITGQKPETEAEIFGNEMDANGGIIEKDGDEPPEIAVLAELSMSGGNSKFVALYCGTAKRPTEEAQSKEKSTFTYGTPSVQIDFIKARNGLLKYSIRTDAKNYNPAIGEAWFDAVPLPPASEAGTTSSEG